MDYDVAESFRFSFDSTQVKVPEDYHGYGLIWFEQGVFYEEDMLRYIQSLNLGGTYIDVGGGFGSHSLFFAKFCPSDIVYTFEPNHKCYKNIEDILTLNGVREKVILSDKAAADKLGSFEATFVIREGQPNWTKVVDAVPLDDTIGRRDVSIIKIDVEGAEPQALTGAVDILKTCSPRLFLEAHDDEAMAAIMEVIGPLGYAKTGVEFVKGAPTYEFARSDSDR